ncbi:MAG: aryl-sulfate sulfotransferase [Bacteroidia bacterium]
MQKIIYRVSIIIVFSFTFFIWGYLTSSFHNFPHTQVKELIHYTKSLKSNLYWFLHKNDSIYSINERFQVYNNELNGSVLIAEQDENEDCWIRICTLNGSVKREFKVDFKLYEKEFEKDFDRRKWSPKAKELRYFIHGMALLPNNQLVFNIEYLGIVCLDSLNEIKWTRGIYTHHSLTVDKQGNLWVCGPRKLNIESDNVYGEDETILCLSPIDGNVIKAWSMKDLLYKNGLTAFAYPMIDTSVSDPFHINDVEPYLLDDSTGFFNKNDVLISMRNISTILVFNKTNDSVKYINSGSFWRQHDPDFFSRNSITLFDNRMPLPRKNSSISRVIELNAVSGKTKSIFEVTKKGRTFITNTMGKHQWINKDYLLITFPFNSSAIIVNSNSRLIWEHSNITSKNSKGVIFDCVYFKN